MVRYLVLSLLPYLLYATQIVEIHYFDENFDYKASLLISLEEKFYEAKGEIKKLDDNMYVINNVTTSAEENKVFKKQGFDIRIAPYSQNSTILILSRKDLNVRFEIDDTTGQGLKVSISRKPTPKESVTPSPLIGESMTKKEDFTFDYVRYVVVMGILLFLLLFLYVIKKRQTFAFSMLKGERQAKKETFDVVFQKPLDQKNKIVLIKMYDKEYLVMTGESNVLLDVIDPKNRKTPTQEIPKEDVEFDDILKLEKSRFDDYKDKASQLKELEG